MLSFVNNRLKVISRRVRIFPIYVRKSSKFAPYLPGSLPPLVFLTVRGMEQRVLEYMAPGVRGVNMLQILA
jgi:hypothetical protein